MIQATQNNLIISITSKYISHISDIRKRAELQAGNTVAASDLVQIVGTVISIPKSITNAKRGYEGFSTKDIRVGDTVIFRFDVILDFIEVEQGQEPIHKNRFEYLGKEYWNCDIQKVFGVIRGGEIIMVNGYVMIADFDENKLFVPQHIKSIRKAQSSLIMFSGSQKENFSKIDISQGDVVFFNPNIAAKYSINNKPFRIIQQDKILGKDVA